jgi:hypothetical protein
MRTITYEAAEEQEETVSAFLMMVLEYATEIGVFRLLDSRVKVKMKAVWYSVLHKAQTVMCSLVMGCAHTKAINDVLGEERAAAAYLGMARFPDQSQINRYLTRLDDENVAQLGEVHAQLFEAHSQARRAVGRIVVDIDQCGLVVNGKTYEWAHKGYFPRKRGEIGYQLSAAYIGAYQEALQVYLDPGNSHCKSRLSTLLADIQRLLLTDNPTVQVIRRLDAGYDSADNRQLLAGLPGYFILKGADSKLAKRLAQTVKLQDWLPVADGVHGTEIEPQAGVRCLLYEFYLSDRRLDYALLYTNLPQAEFGVIRAFEFYNERTTIEAFFAASRHVFNIQSMRSRKFNAIYAFLRFVFLTHNLIHWAKAARLADSPFEHASTRELVDKFTRVRAYVRWEGRWRVSVIATSHWATALLNLLSRPPRLVQLAFPFARLHKT